MDIETHPFQKHTEVRWLSLGPAIARILEQWDSMLQFVKDLAKDPRSAKLERKSTQSSIQNIARKLQPTTDVSQVVMSGRVYKSMLMSNQLTNSKN